MIRLIVGGLVFITAVHCGGSETDPTGSFDPIDGGSNADGATQNDGGITPPPDAPIDSDGPAVEVLFPLQPANGDFSGDAIVTQDRIVVRCSAQPNVTSGDAVDANSVTVEVFGSDGSALEQTAAPSGIPNEYTSDVVLDEVANGPLTVRCSATDTSSEQRTNSSDVATFLDLGPSIAISSPVEGENSANQVEVIFQVTARAVDPADTQAEVDLSSVVVSVRNQVISNVSHQGSGLFKGIIDFDAPEFNPTLDGPISVRVAARNMRTPEAVERTETVEFVADSAGPEISDISPPEGALVSGIVILEATITDPAGVNPNSVIATVGASTTVPMVSIGGSSYQGFFDSRIVESSVPGVDVVFPYINIRAKDLVDNDSVVGFEIALDNQSPIASLDPPFIREADLSEIEGHLECSEVFDPVGEDAANDLSRVLSLSEIRARVEDFGNSGTSNSGIVIPFGGVAETGVRLFVLDDASGALIVDSNGDGVCDMINPKLVPTPVPVFADEAAVLDFAPLTPAGASIFREDPAGYSGWPGCNAPDVGPEELVVQPPVCVSSPATRITETQIGENPVIFSIPPVEQNETQCWGNAFDQLGTNLNDGWACLAIEAEDNLGNVGISPAMRLCFDADNNLSDGCNNLGAGDAFHCSGIYNPATDTVDANTPCIAPLSFRDFPGLQVRRRDL